MVVAGGSRNAQDTCESNLAHHYLGSHYLGSQYPPHKYLKGGPQPPHPQYLPSNQYKGGGSSFAPLEEDSDGGSDNSSSGRGSGGSDLGSDADRLSSRAFDSGRYSADGCDSSSPASSSLSPSSAPNSLPPLPPSGRGYHGNQHNGGGERGSSTRHQNGLGGPQNAAPGEEIQGTLKSSQPSRLPVTHPAVDAPVCSHCLRLEVSFWDPSCPGCASLLRRSDVTPAHIFAILRQWVPQVQRRVHSLVAKALTLGCHVDDRDSLTDMTLLHYAVKAGSSGVGDATTTQQVVGNLLSLGADPRLRCRWTHMTALHYAAYFDVAPILSVLLQHEKGVPVDDPCLEYDSGTPLHIAASNLSLGAAKVLLQHGASVTAIDSKGRTPFECVPTPDQYELVPDVQQVISNLRGLLSPANNHAHTIPGSSPGSASGSSNQGASGKAVLRAMGLKIGDRVLVSGTRTGTLRYVGTTEFAVGLWAGVELETPHGRNNGSVKGVLYFRCPDNYGMFVPVNRLSKIPNVSGARMSRARSSAPRARAPRGNSLPGGSVQANPRRALSLPPGRVNHPRVDVSKVQSRVKMDIRDSKRRLAVEDRVVVDLTGRGARLSGTVRYTGTVHFASGFWIGIDLDLPRGTNDGSVNGTAYFSCKPNHGVFAAPSRVNKLASPSDKDPNSDRIIYDVPPASLPPPPPAFDTNPILSNTYPTSSYSTGPYSLCNFSTTTTNTTNNHYQSIGSSLNESYYGYTPSLSGVGLVDLEGGEVPHLLGPAHLKRAHSLKTALYPSNTSMTHLNRSFSARYMSSRLRQEQTERAREEKRQEAQWQDPPPLTQARSSAGSRKKVENRHWLEIGHNVFYKNEVGVVKYIGQVQFSDGVWLGLELRKAKGRHDGTVAGVRYFSCKQKHGVMVRPSKVTVRGLNGATLVKPDDYDE